MANQNTRTLYDSTASSIDAFQSQRPVQYMTYNPSISQQQCLNSASCQPLPYGAANDPSRSMNLTNNRTVARAQYSSRAYTPHADTSSGPMFNVDGDSSLRNAPLSMQRTVAPDDSNIGGRLTLDAGMNPMQSNIANAIGAMPFQQDSRQNMQVVWETCSREQQK